GPCGRALPLRLCRLADEILDEAEPLHFRYCTVEAETVDIELSETLTDIFKTKAFTVVVAGKNIVGSAYRLRDRSNKGSPCGLGAGFKFLPLTPRLRATFLFLCGFPRGVIQELLKRMFFGHAQARFRRPSATIVLF